MMMMMMIRRRRRRKTGTFLIGTNGLSMQLFLVLSIGNGVGISGEHKLIVLCLERKKGGKKRQGATMKKAR
jgi:hypothetical protein